MKLNQFFVGVFILFLCNYSLHAQSINHLFLQSLDSLPVKFNDEPWMTGEYWNTKWNMNPLTENALHFYKQIALEQGVTYWFITDGRLWINYWHGLDGTLGADFGKWHLIDSNMIEICIGRNDSLFSCGSNSEDIDATYFFKFMNDRKELLLLRK